MQSSNDTISLESIFANAEQQAQSLIERITAYVNERVNDIDAAEALVLDLSNEAARFNKILISIDNTNAQVESGDITKEEAIGTLAPLVKELKEKCTALRISGAELSEDDDIDVNEIAVLREIIIGAKAVVEKRVADLRTDADLSPDTEGFSLFDDNAEPATEAVNYRLYSAMKKSTEAQTAKTLMSNAKKLFNMGSREKAIEYMKKAQALYQKCLDRAKKEAKMVMAERTVGNKVIGFGEDRYKREVTDDFNAAALINYFEDRVDTCKAYILKWRSKNAQSDLKSLKQSLKQERKSERDRIRDQKRANKATESYTNMEVNTMNAREFYAVCENYVGNLDNEISAMCLESYEAIPEVTFTDAMESAKGGRLDGIKSKVEDMKAAIKDPKNAWKVLAISLGVCVSCLAIVYAIQKKVGKQPWTTSVFNSVKKSVDKVKKLRSDARQKKTAGNNTAAYPQEEATKALHEAMAAATNTEKITKLAQKARVEQSGASNYYANNDGKVGEKDTRGTAGHGGKAPEMDLKREGSKLQNQPAPAVRKNASAETRQYLYDMDSVGESFNLFEDDNNLDSALESAINSIFDD